LYFTINNHTVLESLYFIQRRADRLVRDVNRHGGGAVAKRETTDSSPLESGIFPLALAVGFFFYRRGPAAISFQPRPFNFNMIQNFRHRFIELLKIH
jgi:hypothetical protein